MELCLLFALLGVVLGVALGYSCYCRAAIYLFSAAYTWVLLPLILAAVLYPNLEWVERYIRLSDRLFLSFQTLAANRPLHDSFLFLLGFTLGFWIFGLYAGYAWGRFRNLGVALVPSALALSLIHNFDATRDQRLAFFATYLILALLLLGRHVYLAHRLLWQARRLISSAEAQSEMVLTLMVSAATLVLLAWLAPTPRQPLSFLEEWRQSWSQRWQNNKAWKNITASLNTRGAAVRSLYGRTLPLGQQVSKSDVVLFYVEGPAGTRERYIRVRSYEVYQDGFWRVGTAALTKFSPSSAPLLLPAGAGEVQQYVFTVGSEAVNVLATPNRPVWVSRFSQLEYILIDAERREPISFLLDTPLSPGEKYTTQGLRQKIFEEQLRAAGEAYPTWVIERYLQLPDDFPAALSDLARQITASAETPYDKTLAVTRYLRETIRYTTSLPPVPAYRDPIAWFLLEYRAGFCNYYATAEVLLLRSLGIPARLTVGYIAGEYRSGRYVIRERDAHAWPEVYFPGIGWVEFEPTSAQPAIFYPIAEQVAASTLKKTPTFEELRGEEESNVAALEEESTPLPSVSRYASDTLLMLTILFGLSLVTIGLVAWAYLTGMFETAYQKTRAMFNAPMPILVYNWLRKRRLPAPPWLERMAWWAGLSEVERAFFVVYQGLHRLGEPLTSAWTPAEAVARLTIRFPEAGQEVARLLEVYQQALYAPQVSLPEDLQQTARILERKLQRETGKRCLMKIAQSFGAQNR
ncbi:MAG: transglutaminase domain-containing protein [Anaerolineales bacterium]|nr:transglutaminase domain-containing protein [Anaerolineales bacterium]